MSVPQDLIDEIDMARDGLIYFCNLVQVGKREGGGREFERQIHARFRSIHEAIQRNTKEPST